MKSIVLALLVASLVLPGCFYSACRTAQGAAEWFQPGVYDEAVAKGLKDNPYSDEIGLQDTNINNMTVSASIWPDDRVFAVAFINGPTQRYPLNHLEDAVRELFQRNDLTFDPPRFEPYYHDLGCGL